MNLIKIKNAIAVLNEGGIVIFPTDTAFGIGCRIDNIDAINRLFKLRKRPENQAMPVLVNNIEMAEKYYQNPLPRNILHYMDKYWPGALTIIYKCNTTIIPALVRGNGESIGIRMPDHDITLSIIEGIGVPLLGSSANFHGDKTPFHIRDLNRELLKLVDFVVEGKCYKNKASTVIDCTDKTVRIIRQGSVII